jgi:tetrapyrrole methylase family protein / MazG family protein
MTDVGCVVVVGLGPAGPEFATRATLDAISQARVRFVRTRVHPSAELVDDATSFDHLYERADRFGEVYADIVEALVAAANDHGEVLYAVPGSPLVLEDTVARLRRDPRVRTRLVPAMSFLDLAYDRLGVDPVESRLRLVDGHAFATAAAGETGPLLVAHCHANWVLSDIKLAVEGATGDEEVIVLQRLGCADEAVTRTTWADLDRTVAADHLTSIYVPHLGAPVGTELVRFHELARTLRAQCPWDREQTHESLVPYLVEETYEVVDAILATGNGAEPEADDALVEELGDLLYQIEFHAAIAEEQGRFTMADIAQSIHDKLVRRHPHVFGDPAGDANADATDLPAAWDRIKQREKPDRGPFDGLPNSLPALAWASKIVGRAERHGFTLPDPDIAAPTSDDADQPFTAEQLGAVLLSLVVRARRVGLDPESTLRRAAADFRDSALDERSM